MGLRFSAAEVKAYYAARVAGLHGAGGELRGPCPVHKGSRDSFAVSATTGDAYCHSQCGRGWDIVALEQKLTGVGFAAARDEVFRIVGRQPAASRSEVAAYSYTDEAGNVLFQTVRYDPKDFKQRQPDGRGGWTWNLKGVRLVLYHLSELQARAIETVFICEGEKDVHALESLGLLATCNPMGAGKWRDEYAQMLRGRRVVIVTDNDPATDKDGRPHYKGQQHAAGIAVSALRHKCQVRIIEPPRGKDAHDWVTAGATAEEVLATANAQEELTGPTLASWASRWSGPAASAVEEWPAPLELQSELPAVKPLLPELLPSSLRLLSLDIAERMQVPIDYPAIALVTSLAGVVSRRATIQPKAKDDSWVVVPNLWGGIIAPPGFMKSPVIQAATRPLQEIQKRWHHEHQDALRLYEHEKEEAELRHSAWREQYKSSSKTGKQIPGRPSDEVIEPKLRRLIVNDATFEALHQTMADNPAGLLLIRDELTGWLATLDRSGREGERAFCLQAWNGDTGHTIDRIGRGSIYVEACCMSLMGGIQPGRLRSYLTEALQDGPSNDGLIQRFQLLVWPDHDPAWKYVDRPRNAALDGQLAQVFRILLELDPANPLRFRFDAHAQLLFVEWLGGLEGKLRGDEMHPALLSHLSKYKSLMPSLALLFELADRAAAGDHFADRTAFTVSLEHARQAAEFCDYLESHANRIYSCVTTPQMRAARELAAKIKTRKVAADGFFTARDVYLKGWTGLDSPEAVRLAIQVLVDACWVRAAVVDTNPAGGPRPTKYQINPKVRK